jgi:hypothetical protein
MYFLLKSEVETIDIEKDYYKKRLFCPFCKKNQLKKLNSNDLYNKYHCWNKDCENKNVPFILLNEYIQKEELFNDICDTCQQPLHREFKVNENHDVLLFFRCGSKMCESNMNPYCYNLTNQSWQGTQPKFILYDDLEIDIEPKVMIKANIPKIEDGKKEKLKLASKTILEIPEPEPPEIFHKIEEIPLLTMNNEEFTLFLEKHQNKVIILVDVPNFVRTLREVFPRNFEDVLRKAHQLLLEYIENSFHTSSDYIVRYFSKPAKDLDVPNKIIIKFCTQNLDKEYFHLLKIPKGSIYSDIDNYLIANAVEILERCDIRGFIIVSSDKDYLPVMRIASYKNVKARILGINTPEIYEEYHIENIKFLGIMKFFEK